jgi:hypothetical protein
MNDWTTPADIRARAIRDWQKGRILAALLTGDPLYPCRIPLKGPSTAMLSEHFEAVRQWIRLLAEKAKEENGAGYRLEWREINHRQLGRNRIPVAAVFDAAEDALALIGKRRDAVRFQEVADSIGRAFPQLLPWLAKRPLTVLDHLDEWPRLLAVLGWIAEHPHSARYLRQIDLPGVHTKFIERYRPLLSEMLDLVLPAAAIEPSANGVSGFERRYGFKSKPVQIRFRILDSRIHLQGLSDIAVTSSEFARLELAVRRVFLTENEINFLAFPDMPESLVIFGSGYGFEHLAKGHWLRDMAMVYWGDIDTHGFAILDQLRSHFPEANSLMMDRETLLAHRSLWGEEEKPTQRELSRLSPAEADLYDDLRANRLAPNLRLEQEHIGFHHVEAALGALSP